MVSHGAYERVTPTSLTELVKMIRRQAYGYDPMKAFLPQWLFRLHTATPTSQNLLGAELAAPIVLSKNPNSSFDQVKLEQAQQNVFEARKVRRRKGGYQGGAWRCPSPRAAHEDVSVPTAFPAGRRRRAIHAKAQIGSSTAEAVFVLACLELEKSRADGMPCKSL
eukprot:CAMPEP_0119328248 /NCGR_PEP_ID=MMETSP1333-20130426/72858_1 /TAXON_ID=418940 /ORGANISM="Scyphosphaera apsteinii, Strain RCC1455" /LENGTH=164 /DNA_ID=CAMNT_0007337047 /DNA_START=17 /DNA_END=512 /DNA_ORIENTATION=+